MRLTVRKVYCENLVLAVAALGKVYWRLENCYYCDYDYYYRHHQIENVYGSLHVFLKVPKFK